MDKKIYIEHLNELKNGDVVSICCNQTQIKGLYSNPEFIDYLVVKDVTKKPKSSVEFQNIDYPFEHLKLYSNSNDQMNYVRFKYEEPTTRLPKRLKESTKYFLIKLVNGESIYEVENNVTGKNYIEIGLTEGTAEPLKLNSTDLLVLLNLCDVKSYSLALDVFKNTYNLKPFLVDEVKRLDCLLH